MRGPKRTKRICGQCGTEFSVYGNRRLKCYSCEPKATHKGNIVQLRKAEEERKKKSKGEKGGKKDVKS